VLEPEPSLAEVDFAGDARVDHPLQRSIDGRATDALILTADQIDEILGREVALLPEKDVNDEIAFPRPLTAGRPKALDKCSS
jgi:hypothetical protein